MAKLKSTPKSDAESDLAYTYKLVHAFLAERSHKKVASALKQAVNGVATIEDGADYRGPTLQQILKEWKELKAAAGAEESTSTSSDSESSDVSSSDDDSEVDNKATVKKMKEPVPSDSSDGSSDDSDDSDDDGPNAVELVADTKRDSSKTLSSEDDDDSDEESSEESSSDSSEDEESDAKAVKDSNSRSSIGKVKVEPNGLKPKTSSTSSSDTSSDSDSDSDSDEEEKPPKANKPTRKAKSSSSDSSSSSGSSSDSDSEVTRGPPKKTELKPKTAPTTSSSDSSSSSDSDSESDSSASSISEDAKSSKKRRAAAKPVSRSSSSTSSSSSESEDELEATPALSDTPDPNVQPAKKRRTNEEGGAIVTATVKIVAAPTVQKGKASRKTNTPFQRIKVEAVQYEDERLKDNTFESRGTRADDYGAQANRDLIVTRGDGFRKEKNKKKRGSYRGGEITLQSHSFKFED